MTCEVRIKRAEGVIGVAPRGMCGGVKQRIGDAAEGRDDDDGTRAARRGRFDDADQSRTRRCIGHRRAAKFQHRGSASRHRHLRCRRREKLQGRLRARTTGLVLAAVIAAPHPRPDGQVCVSLELHRHGGRSCYFAP